MKKKTILQLSVASLLLALVDFVAFLVVISAIQGACTSAQISAGTCAQAPALIPVFLVFAIAGILLFIAWIGALIRSAKMRTWGWFVVVLLLHGLGTLIYALAGPPDAPYEGWAVGNRDMPHALS